MFSPTNLFFVRLFFYFSPLLRILTVLFFDVHFAAGISARRLIWSAGDARCRSLRCSSLIHIDWCIGCFQSALPYAALTSSLASCELTAHRAVRCGRRDLPLCRSSSAHDEMGLNGKVCLCNFDMMTVSSSATHRMSGLPVKAIN